MKEFAPPEPIAQNASSGVEDITKAFKDIKTLLSLLEPRSSRDTEILSLLNRLNKATFAKMRALKGQENSPGNLPPAAPVPGMPGGDKGIVSDNEKCYGLEETSMAGGGIQGTAGAGLKIDEPVYESKDIKEFRGYIRNLLSELYSLDKENFIEASKSVLSEFQASPSTGMNYLGKFFLQARPAIEKEYLDLQTSQEQRDSFRDNLIKLYTDFINQLMMNSNVGAAEGEFNAAPTNESLVMEDSGQSKDGIFFDDFGYKDPVKEKELQQKAQGDDTPDPHPGTEPTGAAAAARVFKGTMKQLEEIFGSLGDKKDQDMFAQYLPKNVVALFKLLATQTPIEGGAPVTESQQLDEAGFGDKLKRGLAIASLASTLGGSGGTPHQKTPMSDRLVPDSGYTSPDVIDARHPVAAQQLQIQQQALDGNAKAKRIQGHYQRVKTVNDRLRTNPQEYQFAFNDQVMANLEKYARAGETNKYMALWNYLKANMDFGRLDHPIQAGPSVNGINKGSNPI